MTTIQGKRILLGLTGGIAAYKSAELTRLMIKAGADVRVAMSEAAIRFISPTTLQALSGQPVWTDLWDARVPDGMGHIELSRDRDLIVVAPASADFIAKVAHGLANDLLSALCLARRCPLMIAPAMNVEMWENPATQRNVIALRDDGVALVGPEAGDQACGETGMGRMLDPGAIVECIEAFLQPKVLAGRRVLVTAGPTQEPIDPVRMITNASSGKMGFAVARAARDAGAQVTLVAGPVALATPAGIERVDVRTAAEMFDAVKAAVAACDVFVSVAAVADYRVASESAHKIKKGERKGLTLELQENPDILAWVASRAAVLRRVRRGKRGLGPKREGKAGEERDPAACRQPGSGGTRRGLERDHAVRRSRRARPRARHQERARGQARRAHRIDARPQVANRPRSQPPIGP